MDVSSPSQRLAALRLLTASISPTDAGPALSQDAVRSAAAMVRSHALLSASRQGSQYDSALAKFLAAVQDVLQNSHKDSDMALGADLLGLCCSEAGAPLFVKHQTEWGIALLRALSKGPSAKEKAVEALCQLLLRAQALDAVQGVRREASGLVSRLMPGVSSMLKAEPQSEKYAALVLLRCILTVLPASVKSSLSSVEPAVTSLVLAWDTSDHLRAQATLCLAKVPNVTSSADAWQDMAASCAMGVHRLLDEAMPSGYECAKDSVREAALKLLKSEGRWSVWAKALGVDGEQTAGRTPVQRSKLMLALLDLLSRLLSEDVLVPVVVPAMSLLLLATRVLSIDPRAFPESREAVEFLSIWLPEVQGAVLCSLAVMTRSNGLQLAPSLAAMARLLSDQMRVIVASDGGPNHSTSCMVRHRVYSCATHLLSAGGPAVLFKLLDTAAQCIRLELFTSPVALEVEQEAKKPRIEKERQAAADVLAEGLASSGSFVAQRSAALLLQAMLDHGGSLMAPKSRTELDTLAVQFALACRSAASAATRGQGRNMAHLKELQLASYRALLASVQAPCQHRPLFLSQALEVYSAGAHDRCPQVAQLSTSAISVVELALNPRALPFPRLMKLAQEPVDASEGADVGRPRFWSSYTASPGLAGCLNLSGVLDDTKGFTSQLATHNAQEGVSLALGQPVGNASLPDQCAGVEKATALPDKAGAVSEPLSGVPVVFHSGVTRSKPSPLIMSPDAPVPAAPAPNMPAVVERREAETASLPEIMSLDYRAQASETASPAKEFRNAASDAKVDASGATHQNSNPWQSDRDERRPPGAVGRAVSEDMGDESADEESLPDINSGSDSDVSN